MRITSDNQWLFDYIKNLRIFVGSDKTLGVHYFHNNSFI
jgi:hypothetical protein